MNITKKNSSSNIVEHSATNVAARIPMNVTMMKCKIHRATVTGADLSYEGSISIDPTLIKAAGLFLNERVDIYNCNNGARFSTYVIEGQSGEICLNGAAARHVHKGDIVIIVAYCGMDAQFASDHRPQVVFVNEKNQITEIKDQESNKHSET